jgi:hypothetical protein
VTKNKRHVGVATRAGSNREPALLRTPDPRERLREFAEFVESQDAEALAAKVTMPHDTLMYCGRIRSFFRRYEAALKRRVTH